MPLLRLADVSLAYGHLPLLAHVDFEIERGERVCLVGRNGTGKSTLFRVVSGQAAPDEGELWRPPELRIAHLEQEVPGDTAASVFDVVAGGLGELGRLLTEYHHAALDGALESLATLQAGIEAHGGWNVAQKVESVLSRLNLPADRRLADCSGGIRRQVMLARALVSEPDLLLLDEPTNHLDLDAVVWLEKWLAGYRGTLMLVSHDRDFLDASITHVVHIGGGKLALYTGNYSAFEEQRAAQLANEQAMYVRQQREVARLERFVDAFPASLGQLGRTRYERVDLRYPNGFALRVMGWKG